MPGLPVAQFTAAGEIRPSRFRANEYVVVVRIGELNGPVEDEGHLSAMAWMYLSGALKRRGYDLKAMVKALP
jgi:hypothetical protein